MDELVDFAINLTKNSVTVPAGTVFLIGSLSHMERVGAQLYATACVNAKRRLLGAFKKCEIVPFVPPPLGGCNNNPDLIRSIVDTSIWLSEMPSFPLSETMSVVTSTVLSKAEGGGEGVHYDRPISLPLSLDEYICEQKLSPGRPGIPADLPPWSQTDEKKFIETMIQDLNREFITDLDPNPNFSRSAKRPALYPAFRAGSVESVLIIGGSNARNLAHAASSLGVETYQLVKGGWKISKDNIDKMIPDLKEILSSLPAKTPVVFFCLDNSSFLAASEEGGMVPISKCVPEDDGYHVPGALVVAPERAMQYATSQLRRAIAECGEFPVFIITPWARYASQPCCIDPGHVTNFQDPDFLPDLLRDLNKQKFELRKSLAPAMVLDGIQLVCGDSCNMEKKVQTMRAGWASDPVHPNGHIYAKMALNLIEKVAGSAGQTTTSAGGRKRTWSSSNREDHNTATSRHQQGDRSAGGGSSNSGGGGGGGGRGNQRDSDSGGGGSSGRATGRSADWKMRGGNTGYGHGYGHFGRGGQPHYGSGGGGGSAGNREGGTGGARGFPGRGGRGSYRGQGGYNAGQGGYRY
jgi:hypothetical protein